MHKMTEAKGKLYPRQAPHLTLLSPVDTCGYLWIPVGTCGYLWIPVDTCGYLWMLLMTLPLTHRIRQSCACLQSTWTDFLIFVREDKPLLLLLCCCCLSYSNCLLLLYFAFDFLLLLLMHCVKFSDLVFALLIRSWFISIVFMKQVHTF